MPKASSISSMVRTMDMIFCTFPSGCNDISWGECLPISILEDKIRFPIATEYKENFCSGGKFSMESCLQDMYQFPTRWDVRTEEAILGIVSGCHGVMRV